MVLFLAFKPFQSATENKKTTQKLLSKMFRNRMGKPDHGVTSGEPQKQEQKQTRCGGGNDVDLFRQAPVTSAQ